MITINVFPAKQGFVPPPDGGVIVPNTSLPGSLDVVQAGRQGFPPAPNLLFAFTGPFPTPAEPPVRPADVGVPPIPSLSSVIPPALEVNVNEAAGLFASLNPRDIVISDAGSFEVNPGQAVRTYGISAIVDNETGLPPNINTVNLRLTLTGAPLTSYGITLSGRSLIFPTLSTLPQNPPPERVIMAWGIVAGANLVIIPNKDPSGANPISTGLNTSDTALFDSARYSSEVVFQNFTLHQDVIPQTLPLLNPPGSSSFYAIPDVFVAGQGTTFPNPSTVFVPQNPVSLVEQIPGQIPNEFVIEQPPFIGLPDNHPPLDNPISSDSSRNVFIR